MCCRSPRRRGATSSAAAVMSAARSCSTWPHERNEMTVSFFLTFEQWGKPDARIGGDEKAHFAAIVKATPNLRKALIYTPESTEDPYLDDGPPPLLAAQLYFADIAALEAALLPGGHLQGLASARDFPSLAGAEITQQAMLTRVFPVPDPQFRTGRGALPCTYLVAYEGTAQDLNLWLSHYVTHHPPI